MLYDGPLWRMISRLRSSSPSSPTRSRSAASAPTDLVVETKPDLTPVTEADTRGRARRCASVSAGARPDDSVVGEEFGVSTAPDSSRRWIVDPIDGTKNYVRGIPVWATLLALEDGDELVVGVVSAPGAPAPLVGGARTGRVRRRRARRIAAAAPNLRRQPARRRAALRLRARRLGGVRSGSMPCSPSSAPAGARAGSATSGRYMLVAEGAADICCEPIVSLWDLAAPQVIVEEAGGRFTDLGGVRDRRRRRRARHQRAAARRGAGDRRARRLTGSRRGLV